MSFKGASRETSPSRVLERKMSAGARLTQGTLRMHQKAMGAQRVLVPTTDGERVLADALLVRVNFIRESIDFPKPFGDKLGM